MSFMISHQTSEFAGDSHAFTGAWGPSTSRANFCEEDYVISFYVAEFVNSLTNLAYIYPALKYMYGRGSGGILRPNVDFMSISLLVLGVGSFLFHASLRHTLEFVDELSMLGLTWSMLHAAYTAHQSPTVARTISIALAVFHIPFLAFYVWSSEIIVQVIGFVGAIVLIGLRTHHLLHRPELPKDKSRDWIIRTWTAVAISLLGYLLWNIDLKYCTELRNLRHQVGLPWAWLFEFHGWWHVLTAVGAGQFTNIMREVQGETGGRKRE
ncbi:ceramidase [Apodospora peruviana]|uniref:Ceramidase n=1 Tax=Apodospora peruviana TaxID=516989 RepID=A0AAE0MDY6_9PEZI|nr:ceramidase [Apodospora peruviana]